MIKTLPGDLAVHDPNWSETHRVVGVSARKKWLKGSGFSDPSVIVWHVVTGCDVEFESAVEPAATDGTIDTACPLCWQPDIIEGAA